MRIIKEKDRAVPIILQELQYAASMMVKGRPEDRQNWIGYYAACSRIMEKLFKDPSWQKHLLGGINENSK